MNLIPDNLINHEHAGIVRGCIYLGCADIGLAHFAPRLGTRPRHYYGAGEVRRYYGYCKYTSWGLNMTTAQAEVWCKLTGGEVVLGIGGRGPRYERVIPQEIAAQLPINWD